MLCLAVFMSHSDFLVVVFAHLVFYGINNIDDTVTGFFKVANDVHIYDTCLVFIYFVVDILDVVCAELSAEVVDFSLFVVRCDNVVFASVFNVFQKKNVLKYKFYSIPLLLKLKLLK